MTRGPAMCAWAVLAWTLSAAVSILFLIDPRVTDQVMSGGDAGLGWLAWSAAGLFLVGAACAVVAARRGPRTVRWISNGLQLVAGVPVLLLAGYACAMSLAH